MLLVSIGCFWCIFVVLRCCNKLNKLMIKKILKNEVIAIKRNRGNEVTNSTEQTTADKFSTPVCLIIPTMEGVNIQSVIIEFNQKAAELIGLKTVVETVEKTTVQSIGVHTIVIRNEDGAKTRFALGLDCEDETSTTCKQEFVKCYSSTITPTYCTGIYQQAGFNFGEKLSITDSWYFELETIKGIREEGKFFTFTALQKN